VDREKTASELSEPDVLAEPDEPARSNGLDVSTYLLVELRRANRKLHRLRAVALAARDGDAARLRLALARLFPSDLEARRPSAGRRRGR
jgi:hypothetical protein